MSSLLLGQRVHFVGVGGFGMSAIARVLLQRGHTVSGSDRSANQFTRQLADDGAVIHIGHDAANIGDAETVIVSSAITAQNPEVIAAQARGLPIFKRSEMLSALMAGHQTLAVAGTHGKTTTTAMLAHILLQTQRDPSYIVGGVMANTGDNAHHGSGGAFVIEADEYDNMFHGLHPDIAIVTSLEYDHPDFFTTPQSMTDSFKRFVQQVMPEGVLILCADNDAAALRSVSSAPVVTYGFLNGDWRISELAYISDRMQFTVLNNGVVAGEASLAVFGQHNALNALAAALAAHSYGVALPDALSALGSFLGTGRRFEIKGEIGDVIVVDDYAHHPTAIATTLDAARRRYPQHTLWAVWQPHTFSRTLQLMHEYAQSFEDAHHVLVTDIFPSRESFTDTVHSRDVVARMQHADARTSGTLDATADILLRELQAPAVVLVMSAGDAPRVGELVLAGLQARDDS